MYSIVLMMAMSSNAPMAPAVGTGCTGTKVTVQATGCHGAALPRIRVVAGTLYHRMPTGPVVVAVQTAEPPLARARPVMSWLEKIVARILHPLPRVRVFVR